MSEPVIHPIQLECCYGKGVVPQAVTLRAYEVYAHVHGPQQALITGDCRGGFGIAELIAFLYAASFPKGEWRDRVGEAFYGLHIRK
jgi:hypothetical protein